MYEKINSRHCEKRKHAWKEVRKSKINRETFERSSKVRKKKRQIRSDEEMLIQHLFDAGWNKKR